MELWHNRILVLDFGSQYTQLIARRIREAEVYSQILPCTVPLATILAYRPQGIVLSGGPSSVYEKKAPSVPKELFLGRDHYTLRFVGILWEWIKPAPSPGSRARSDHGRSS